MSRKYLPQSHGGIHIQKMLEERGLSECFTVSSSATSSEDIFCGVGNPVYPPARAQLKKHGILCDGKRAVQLKRSDYANYDLFIGMDSANIRNMNLIFGSDPDSKIRKLMDYTSRGGDVADPWYSDRFDIAYSDIYQGCCALLEELVK